MTKLELLAKLEKAKLEDLQDLKNYKGYQKKYPALYKKTATAEEKKVTASSMISAAGVIFHQNESHPMGFSGKIKEEFSEMLMNEGMSRMEARKYYRTEGKEKYFDFVLDRVMKLAQQG